MWFEHPETSLNNITNKLIGSDNRENQQSEVIDIESGEGK